MLVIIISGLEALNLKEGKLEYMGSPGGRNAICVF